MHYNLEIIMPPCPKDEIEDRILTILAPFNECKEDAYHPFWDWWVIGGRFSGTKLMQLLDQDKLQEFYARLSEEKITVSSVLAGKQRLEPESQIPLVDKLWKEYFPDYPGEHCPEFTHAGPELTGDILTWGLIKKEQTAFRVIIASSDNEAIHMEQRELWNGVSFSKAAWDGTLLSAVEGHLAHLKHATEEYKEKITPKDDWWVVTVDYHS